MEVASLTTKVEIDVSKLGPSLNSLKGNVEELAKNMTGLTANVTNLTNSMEKAGAGVTKLKKPTDDLGGSSGNLGRYMRELTTGMLGVSPVTIALGTVMGNLATQMLSRVVLAIVSSITQFATLQNSLAEVSSISNQVANSFTVITTAALTSQKSLGDLTKSYAALQQSAIGTRVTVEEVNKIFLAYEAHLATLQQPTILSSASQALTAFGDAFARLDQLLGASSGIVFLLGKVRDAISYIAGFMPKVEDKTVQWKNELASANTYAKELADRAKAQVGWATLLQDTQRRQIENWKVIADLQDKIDIAAGKKLTAEQEIARSKTLKDINADLDKEIELGKFLTYEQEVLNKLYMIANQVRTTGKELTQDETKAMRDKLQIAQAAGQFQSIRESLVGEEQLEKESFARRLTELQIYLSNKQEIAVEANRLFEMENARSYIAIANIQRQQFMIGFNAATAAATGIANVFQIMGQKNKAAAIAGLAVNTAVAVAQAYMANEAAAMQALAVPPAPNWGYYTFVKAMGAIQIASIIAAGALQIGNAGGGGGGAGGSFGGGSTGSTTATAASSTTPPTPPSQAITIEGVDPAMVYTGTQLNALIERMNDAVKNGATMITTKTRSG
jgi:hypothetical protein